MKALQSSECSSKKSYNKMVFWKNHLKLQKESGLTRPKYCEHNNLNYHVLGYWLRKLEQQDTPSFVPVKINARSESPNSLCTLKLKTGHTLSIHSLEVLAFILKDGI